MARRKQARRVADREKTASERLLEIFEVLPGLYSERHLFPLMPEDDAFVHKLLERLAERKVLQRETIDGVAAYWDPAHGFDPRRGVLRTLGLLPLNFPLNKAVRRARSALERRILRVREEVGAHDFAYLPLWRIPAEVYRGKGKVGRDFFVHGVNRKLAVLEGGRLVFRDVVKRPPWGVETLVAPAKIDRVPAEKVREEIRPVKVAPEQAAEILRRAMGVRPNPAKVELCLLPLWRFEIRHRLERLRRPRHIVVDGTFGSTFRETS
ncbi:MAG: hypothetical protein E6K10_02450 [Methanobacteriota archaeon]|nr:MAG: hypothetical protein E6K10_02450 [Euryarchaeota archaeon]